MGNVFGWLSGKIIDSCFSKLPYIQDITNYWKLVQEDQLPVFTESEKELLNLLVKKGDLRLLGYYLELHQQLYLLEQLDKRLKYNTLDGFWLLFIMVLSLIGFVSIFFWLINLVIYIITYTSA